MNADSARHLRQARDHSSTFGAVEHHQSASSSMMMTNVGAAAARPVRSSKSEGIAPSKSLLNLVDVAHARLASSLGGVPFRAQHCARRSPPAGLGNEGVKSAAPFVHAEFHALGIDEDEPHLRRRGAEKQAHDHGVDGYRFAPSLWSRR